jgi:hypothetical protein
MGAAPRQVQPAELSLPEEISLLPSAPLWHGYYCNKLLLLRRFNDNYRNARRNLQFLYQIQ